MGSVAIPRELADDLIDTLHDARESLIEHAVQLPLKRRNHGPALVRIDKAIERIVEASRG